MNTRPRTKLRDNGSTKGKGEMQGNRPSSVPKAVKNRLVNARERKTALQQDVDKLKKKLRHEENVHRALERAFNRPLGTLPRLPPYLPPATLELLAEVAVLEEEVVRLEEQVVHCRQDLYQEAVYISSSKKNMESFADVYDLRPHKNLKPEQPKPNVQNSGSSATSKMKLQPSFSEDEPGNKKLVSSDSAKSSKGTSIQKVQPSRTPVKKPPVDCKPTEKNSDPQRLQTECRVRDQENAEPGNLYMASNCPNKISEEIVKSLRSIFIRMSSIRKSTVDKLPFLTTLVVSEIGDEVCRQDPYSICAEFGDRDIGPYKSLYSIDAGKINLKRRSNSLFLLHRLKLQLGKLVSVDLQNLTHQEKLAFWINIFNACMMNAFLEYGIPDDPETVVALMQKARINVGGHSLNPITIEHFILRLPYHSKYTSSKGSKNDEIAVRSKFGLELSEPLVTFALSCGSWSSPAVRVYTVSGVENELEVAKREYLQAAIGISTTKFAIPKLLDWYLLDFAKDLESLLDWVCLQLPNELGKEAIKCLESGKSEPHSAFVQAIPYEFSFRYLLCT